MEQFSFLLKLLPVKPLSLLCGKMLGDGSLTIEEKRKPRFRFQHCIEDKEWCEYCYLCLRDFLPLAPPKYKYTNDPRLKSGFSESFFVQSKTSEIFILLKELWYEERKKRIPFGLISYLFNEELLAWWYQDDGCYINDNGIPRKIIISTDSFTEKENKFLIKLLNERFSLRFSLDRKNRLCLYNQPQIYSFLLLIDPFIHPSMKRKKLRIKQLDLSAFPNSRRTTIYLPTNIKINYPTQDIHNIVNEINEEEIIKLIQSSYLSNNCLVTKGYQIVLLKEQLIKLWSIKSQTGLSYSRIVQLGYDHFLKIN